MFPERERVIRSFWVHADDGAELSVLERRPPHPLATVVLLPAMMVDRRTFDAPPGAGLASTLLAAGLSTWLADFRGHGASRGPRRSPASFRYDELVTLDVPALVRAARAETDRPVFVVGHSLGGHVSLASVALGLAAPDALALLATNVWMPRHEPSPGLRALKAATMAGFLGLARRAGRFPTRRLGLGTVDEPRAYVEDLVTFWRRDAWVVGGVDVRARLGAVSAPVLSILGSGDRLYAHPVGARRFAAEIGPRGAEVWLRGGHGGFPVDHMGLVTDPRARPIWVDLAGWLVGRAASAGLAASARRG